MENTLTLDQIGLKYADPTTVKGKGYQGGDKTSLGHNFTQRYHELFASLRDKEVNLLELGILNGRSLAMWSDYFPNGQIYGIDCHLGRYNKTRPELEELGAFKNNNIQVFKCDITNNEEFTNLIVGHDWPASFGIIMDDALHQSKAQYQNFISLFPTKLESGGIYVIEDIEKPLGFIQQFQEILAGVSSQNSKYTKNHKLGDLIQQIEWIEIRSNNIFIKKK